MSELQTTKITNRAGTGSPNFTNGVKISGTDSGLLAPTRTEGATQPDAETSSNGDTFYDTANDTYDILIEDAWVRVIGAAEEDAPSWTIDLSNVTYDNVSFTSSSQIATPRELAFSTDGTKMYILGYSQNAVFQYSLSTAFDLSTASYDSVSFSVSSQETNVTGMIFKPDGTKMYVIGQTSDTIFQYSLSTAFDLSTASYDSVSFGVSSQDTVPAGLAFNPDGTKLYMCGTGFDKVHQYSLSTGFDMSTASYDSVSFIVGNQESKPYTMAFNTDGTKMYVAGYTSDNIHQYSLSTGFDLSTASYDNVSFSFASQDNVPLGMSISSDGTKLYMCGNQNDKVHQYSTGL